MNANIKLKYKGSNPDFTLDGIYQVLGLSADGGTPYVIILSDVGQLVATHLQGGSPDFELVSVTVPGEVQLYP